MPETLIKVDLTQSAYDNDMVHNRWHPDIPMVAMVKPGDDFIVETYDWTGGFIKNNDSADDVRDIDLSIVHFLSGPIGVEGAEPGDLLVVDLLDIGAKPESQWGFNGFFSKKNGGGFLDEHFPQAQKSIWDFEGMFTKSRHIPGVRFPGLIHPGLIGCLPDPKMLETWNTREKALYDTNPDNAWKRLKPKKFSAKYLAAFKAVAVWRERAAQERDQPRGRWGADRLRGAAPLAAGQGVTVAAEVELPANPSPLWLPSVSVPAAASDVLLSSLKVYETPVPLAPAPSSPSANCCVPRRPRSTRPRSRSCRPDGRNCCSRSSRGTT